MKCLLTLLFLAVSYASFCQSANNDFQLDTIRDYRIKIDGGCGFFHFQGNESDSAIEKNCFVIDQFKRGFFAIKNQHDYIYVKRIRHEYIKNGFFKEVFSGNGFTCILITKKSSVTDQSLREGVLEIRRNGKSRMVKVKGHVDDQPQISIEKGG
jgi:hypothetical protein